MNLLYLLAVTLSTNEINIPRNTADDVLAGGLGLVYTAAGIVAVLVIVLAGFRYVTAAGDSAAIAKAKNTILYAVVGLVVIILAFAVTWFVIGRF